MVHILLLCGSNGALQYHRNVRKTIIVKKSAPGLGPQYQLKYRSMIIRDLLFLGTHCTGKELSTDSARGSGLDNCNFSCVIIIIVYIIFNIFNFWYEGLVILTYAKKLCVYMICLL